MPKIKHPRMIFCLPTPMKKWLAQLAKETGISEAEHIRRSLSNYQVYLSKIRCVRRK